jgi:hypothetical protein
MKLIKRLFNGLSSMEFLFWIIVMWVLFYVVSAVWKEEAFTDFVLNLKKSVFFQVPFFLFLVSGVFNLLRISKRIIKEGIVRFVLWLILPVGLLVFFSGYFISMTSRDTDWILAGEGHSVGPRWSEQRYKVEDIRLGLRDSYLDLQAKGALLQNEPQLTLVDRSSSSSRIGAFPPTRLGDTYYHILTYGFAPGISLSKDGVILNEGYMALKVLTVSSDFFEIIPYPYRFVVSLSPQKKFKKGEIIASEFNLKDPRYDVRVFRGEKVIAEGNSEEKIEFEKFVLSFTDTSFWVQLEAVRDPAVPVVLTGLLLILFGIPFSSLYIYMKARESLRKQL